MQTCWWPLSDHWSVQATSPHLSGFVFYGCLESLTELSALCVQKTSAEWVLLTKAGKSCMILIVRQYMEACHQKWKTWKTIDHHQTAITPSNPHKWLYTPRETTISIWNPQSGIDLLGIHLQSNSSAMKMMAEQRKQEWHYSKYSIFPLNAHNICSRNCAWRQICSISNKFKFVVNCSNVWLYSWCAVYITVVSYTT